jgi:serine/threonine protein kinase
MQPRTISHYEIIEKLGEGGMGVVYKARDSRLDRLVALKLLPPHLLGSEQARRRFADEARAISALNHPGIATIYDVTEDEASPVLVLEYLSGGTLRERLAGKRLALEDIVKFTLQIADALGHAHRHGILHRDVKAENILFTEDGRLKITDFGLARFDDGRTLTVDGVIRGTLANIAPECIQGLQPDRRADIFSLGVLLFEMAAGRPPFMGESPPAVLYAIAHTPAPAFRQCRPDLPESFGRIVLRALAKKPEERYQSAEELAADLRGLSGDSRGAEPVLESDAMPTVLVVEDEDDVRKGIELNLSREGFRVLTAAKGQDGARMAAAENPDVVLLDVMLPGMNGFDVCRELRRNGFGGRVIMLSARSEEIDRVVGLEIGADDYVTKPFSMRELLARVRAHLRTSAARTSS